MLEALHSGWFSKDPGSLHTCRIVGGARAGSLVLGCFEDSNASGAGWVGGGGQ